MSIRLLRSLFRLGLPLCDCHASHDNFFFGRAHDEMAAVVTEEIISRSDWLVENDFVDRNACLNFTFKITICEVACLRGARLAEMPLVVTLVHHLGARLISSETSIGAQGHSQDGRPWRSHRTN